MKNFKDMAYNERLKVLMDLYALTGKDLSNKSGISEATISRIRRGEIVGSADTWISIAAAFGLPVEIFFKKKEE